MSEHVKMLSNTEHVVFCNPNPKTKKAVKRSKRVSRYSSVKLEIRETTFACTRVVGCSGWGTLSRAKQLCCPHTHNAQVKWRYIYFVWILHCMPWNITRQRRRPVVRWEETDLRRKQSYDHHEPTGVSWLTLNKAIAVTHEYKKNMLK